MKIQKRTILILTICAAFAFSACGGGSGDNTQQAAINSPANVSATAGSREVTITWDAVTGADSYNIYFKTSAGVAVSDTKITGTASPYVHRPVSNGTTYYYAISAVDAGAESSLSNEASAMPNFTSTQIEKFLSSDCQAGDNFGYSVAISGDYAIVGASGEDGGAGDPLSIAGAAYIFHRTGTNTWDTGLKIYASDAEAGDSFACSVAMSDDHAIVGAYNEDEGGINAGAAYIY